MSSDAPFAETHQTEKEHGEDRKGLRFGLGAARMPRIAPVWIVAVSFGLLIAWQWYDTHSQIAGLKYELAKRLADADAGGEGIPDACKRSGRGRTQDGHKGGVA